MDDLRIIHVKIEKTEGGGFGTTKEWFIVVHWKICIRVRKSDRK